MTTQGVPAASLIGVDPDIVADLRDLLGEVRWEELSLLKQVMVVSSIVEGMGPKELHGRTWLQALDQVWRAIDRWAAGLGEGGA